MRYQNGIIGIVGLALAAVVATSAVYSDQFAQAASGQGAGFDALAHELLDDLLPSDEGQSK
ncbi:MAG: hypothetical protein V4484_10250 [Pseudomonadota bacterium]